MPNLPAVTLAEFQQLIRRMYMEKDVARGIDGTFMWLMEEVGELAAALRNGTHEERTARVRRRAGLAGHDRQRGGRRSDRGGDAEVRRGLSRLRPVRLHVSRCGKAMSRRMQNAKCKLQNANCRLQLQFAFCNLHFAFCILACCVLSHRFVPPSRRPSSPSRRRSSACASGWPIATRSGCGRRSKSRLRGGSEALAGEVSVIVPDGDGVPSRVSTPPDQPCQVLPGRETTVRLLVPLRPRRERR